jgi:hypothetical protein
LNVQNTHKLFNSFSRKSVLVSVCFSFLLTIISNNYSFAQKSKIDSLQKLLLVAKDDTSKVKYMWQMARDMGVFNPDSALILAQRAFTLHRILNILKENPGLWEYYPILL